MERLRKIIIVPLILFSLMVSANNKQMVDSLKVQLASSNDSLKIPILIKLSWEHRNFNPELCVRYGLDAIEIAAKYNDFASVAKAHSFVGVGYRILGSYSKSIDFYFTGLDIATRHNIKEQEGYAYINIANLHIYQEHYSRSIENLSKALSIAKEMDNKSMLGYVYINYGRAKQLVNDFDSALVYFHKALEIRMVIDQIPEQAVCYKYIGDIYFEKNDLTKANENYSKSLGFVNKETDRDLFANILIKIAEIDFRNNRLASSLNNAVYGHEIAIDIGARLAIRDASQVLSEIYLLKGDYKNAAKYLNCVIRNNDTLFNQQLSEKIFFVEYQLEREIKENKIDILNKENTIKELQLNRAKTFNITLSIILILLTTLFFLALISLNYRRTKNRLLEKQNKEINEQRLNIEQKNRNLEEAYTVIEGYIGKITDSIRYAEKIQEAILPPLSLSEIVFSDAFSYYKPKDFVSGDFYWLATKGNKLFVAVADCTGHGVPGAFMSIIGMDLLNQAISQERTNEPSDILEFLNVELPKKLKREHDENILKDSMDIAICAIDTHTKELSYSGALIPFMLVRNQEIISIKSNYTSIGSPLKTMKRPFKQHAVKLMKDDWVYLYSDGYMDQIGGEERKKFMRKPFQEMLVTLSKLNGEMQLSELNNIFTQWKGNNEQIDDVLVLGLKV